MSALNEVINYVLKQHFQSAPGVYRAVNRAEVNGRLLNWSQEFVRNGASADKAALMAAILGELGNNSFDHNLGQWTDLPGCVIGIDILPDRFRISVGDRGQGIANSLRRVKPNVTDHAALLKVAFEEIISGRSPEKRGNGLKFIKKNFLSKGGLELVCQSSGTSYCLGENRELRTELSSLKFSTGTLTVIDWSR